MDDQSDCLIEKTNRVSSNWSSGFPFQDGANHTVGVVRPKLILLVIFGGVIDRDVGVPTFKDPV